MDMKELPDEIVNLTVTSPPYGTIKDYSEDTEQIGNFKGDLQIEKLKEVFKEVYRLTKDGGFCAINIGEYIQEEGYLYPFSAKLTLMMIEIGFKYIRNIIWKKPSSQQNIFSKFKHHYNMDTEYIIIFRKQTFFKEEEEKRDYSDKELLHNVWNIQPNTRTSEDDHIAIFPEELPKRIINLYSKEGDIILEPFTGSGTTINIAYKLQRHSIGYEINKEYCKLIINNINPKQKRLDGLNRLFFYGENGNYIIPEDILKCLK